MISPMLLGSAFISLVGFIFGLMFFIAVCRCWHWAWDIASTLKRIEVLLKEKTEVKTETK